MFFADCLNTLGQSEKAFVDAGGFDHPIFVIVCTAVIL